MPALAIHAELLDPKTARLRALRLERDATRQQELDARTERYLAAAAATPRAPRYSSGPARATFWDNIDTSGGVDACHWWTGGRKWNHPDANRERYEDGNWREPGCRTHIARRVLMFKTYGRELPEDKDVSPLCDEHLCCNVRHMVITPHGGPKEERLRHAIPVEEYFCDGPSNAEVNQAGAGIPQGRHSD